MFLEQKEYDNIRKIADTGDIKATTITNITPSEVQVLDPDNYDTVDLKKLDVMDNLNIGEEINVIKIKSTVYVILDDK